MFDYLDNKVVAVLVIDSLETVEEKISKLLETGFNVIEVTLRTECALDAIKLIKDKFPDIRLGAGTILTEEQLNQSIEAGADFGVSPGFNPSVANRAKELGFPFIPGVATPSEVELARESGFKLLKLFPAKVLGGIDYIKALSGPYTDITFMPTGGITKDTANEYLKVKSVTCVGGTWMSK